MDEVDFARTFSASEVDTAEAFALTAFEVGGRRGAGTLPAGRMTPEETRFLIDVVADPVATALRFF